MEVTDLIFPGDMTLPNVVLFHQRHAKELDDYLAVRIDFSLVKSTRSIFIGFILNLRRDLGEEKPIIAKNLKEDYFELLAFCKLQEVIARE